MINQKVLENSSSQLESRYYIDEIDSHSIKIGANWIIEWYRKPVNEDSDIHMHMVDVHRIGLPTDIYISISVVFESIHTGSYCDYH